LNPPRSVPPRMGGATRIDGIKGRLGVNYGQSEPGNESGGSLPRADKSDQSFAVLGPGSRNPDPGLFTKVGIRDPLALVLSARTAWRTGPSAGHTCPRPPVPCPLESERSSRTVGRT